MAVRVALFRGPRLVLALAGIRRLVVLIKAIQTDDLLPSSDRTSICASGVGSQPDGRSTKLSWIQTSRL